MLSVALFQFSQSSYTASEDFSAINICLELVDGLLAANVTIELVQGTADMMATRKEDVTSRVISIVPSIQTKHSIIMHIHIGGVQAIGVAGGSNLGKEIFTISKAFTHMRIQM